MSHWEWVLRATGLSLIGIAALHGIFWRLFLWGEEPKRMSPLNARVFWVHLFFVMFVLAAQGLLLLVRPDLLMAKSELARFVLGAFVVFFLLRLVAQPLVFDPVFAVGHPSRNVLRLIASLGWVMYVVIFGVTFAAQ